MSRARALAQVRAATWGGDGTRFILMGHSSEAHLVSQLASSPSIGAESGIKSWLGAVSLDSTALDAVQIVQNKHYRFYDLVFGSNRTNWEAVPFHHALTKAGQCFLAVCSTRRDDSCSQATWFVTKAFSLGMLFSVLQQNLSQRSINKNLGKAADYTEGVESFLRSLDPSVADRMGSHR